jgi:GNAT superfamily N-acetyltransferase
MITTTRISDAEDAERVRIAYEGWNYTHAINASDTVWLAENQGELVGVVRIAREEDVLVLRGMRVARDLQGRGVGSQLLRAVVRWLRTRECFCIPYVHLIGFYGQVGFLEIAPEGTPAFLAQRLADYRRLGLAVTLMRRAGSPAEDPRLS